MVFLSDLKPFYYGARLMGCYPGVVLDYEHVLTTWGVVYSLVWVALFTYMLAYGVYLIFGTNSFIFDLKLLLLIVTRTSLYYVCIYVDNLLTVIYNGKLNAALQQLREFDRATRFTKAPSSNIIKRNKSSLAVLAIFSYWMVVAYLTYMSESTEHLFNAVTYGIINAALSMQLMKFVGLMLLLHQRFRHLDEMIYQREAPDSFCGGHTFMITGALMASKDKSLTLSDNKNVSSDVQRDRALEIQEIWWLHWCLANATEMIGSVYATQMLFWIAIMSFNALSRIYTLIEGHDTLFLLNVRESFLVVACCVYLICIIGSCHFTSMKANKIGQSLFSPASTFSKKRHTTEEQIEIGIYFQLKQLQFFAAGGLVRVDLPLLLSIAGAITTYLVILHATHV